MLNYVSQWQYVAIIVGIYFTEETNKIDIKGRVCLPFSMRQQLPKSSKEHVYAYRDVKEPRLLLFDEEFIQDLLKKLHDSDDQLDIANVKKIEITSPSDYATYEKIKQKQAVNKNIRYSSVSNGFLTRIAQVKIDDTGRLLLNSRLQRHVNLTQSVTFCGLGKAIGVYEPKYFEKRTSETLEDQLKARLHVATLVGGLP